MTRYRAALLALFVTFLWATSWVLIKFGLADVPPLTFAGLRYSLAFLLLFPFVFIRSRWTAIQKLTQRQWLQITLLGVMYYAVTQGAQFVALALLPAVSVSLILNLTPFVVVIFGILWLREPPTPIQWFGLALNLTGVALYFVPFEIVFNQLFGIGIAFIGMLASASSAVLGRHMNRAQSLDALSLTALSMGIGSLLLLCAGIVTNGVPALQLDSWLIIFWLAIVNTAVAFTLWNHTLRSLTAMQSSIINSTLLVQIAILAWVFLGETFTLQQILGMSAAACGALLAQIRVRR
ncbi:MAG: EamA family transporter [Chloroflexi bacterium]|nr:EamA family transporter [Chloroflexota bacterium]